MNARKLFGLMIVLALVTLAVVSVASAQGPALRAPRTALGTGFTYQGQLKNGGTAVNSTCDFEFSLWDGPNLGANQIGSDQPKTNVTVTNGLFTIPDLDFGSGAFTGDARYLLIGVRCPVGSGTFSMLTPRQKLTPAPYALALPGLYTQQDWVSPMVIGGYSGNTVDSGAYGATIGGGGESSYINRVTAYYGTIGGGAGNTAGAVATVGGGYSNTASGLRSTVPGGMNNIAAGQESFAAGNQAIANHDGTFVWADNSGTPITSTTANQFVIRATNGVSLTMNAGSSKSVAVGERYRDNAIIAWGDIGSGGGWTNQSFGISSVTKSTGTYTITLTATPSNSYNIVPIAMAELDSPPTSAASARLVTVNVITANQFVVYITNGNYALTDNQFVFIVTGR